MVMFDHLMGTGGTFLHLESLSLKDAQIAIAVHLIPLHVQVTILAIKADMVFYVVHATKGMR